jgi:hypothetical protein
MDYKLPKRLVYSLAIALVWLGFIVEGSHALFADAVSVTDNKINTGSVDLQVSTSQDSYPLVFNQTEPGFNFILDPGKSVEKYVTLKNVSPSDVALDIFTYTALKQTNISDAKMVSLEITPVDQNGLLMGTVVKEDLSVFSTSTFKTNIVLGKGMTQRFLLKMTLDPLYINQNQGMDFDIYFSGVQHEGV